MNGPLEAEAGRQRPGSREAGAGRQEAGEIRMFNHWAIGLRSGLLPEGCGVATPEVVQQKGPIWGEVFARVLTAPLEAEAWEPGGRRDPHV